MHSDKILIFHQQDVTTFLKINTAQNCLLTPKISKTFQNDLSVYSSDKDLFKPNKAINRVVELCIDT